MHPVRTWITRYDLLLTLAKVPTQPLEQSTSCRMAAKAIQPREQREKSNQMNWALRCAALR